MHDALISFRNHIIGFLYRHILKQFFFRLDPEMVHGRMILVGRILGLNPLSRILTKLMFYYSADSLEQTILGIRFKNPIGLAAGFDKDARLTAILPEVGFGFVEVGSITGERCAGNPKPRLWRLPESKSLVVNYGLKNDGAEIISARLKGKKFNFPLGTSIAKTNNQETCEIDAGVADYVKGFGYFADIGDYFTINISCPNAYGGQPFTESSRLEKLLRELRKIPTKKPIFIKLSPDLSKESVDKIISLIFKYKMDGVICTNLTKNRHNPKIVEKVVPENGGMSGKVVEDLSDELIRYVYRKTGGKMVIIGCGGVFNAADAYKKICLGASLVQMVTGMIYQGPQVIGEINQGLVRLLKLGGLTSISQAVGIDNELPRSKADEVSLRASSSVTDSSLLQADRVFSIKNKK